MANTLYEANKLFYDLENYTDKVLFFPMDDFLTSEALAISPELEITRLETINELLKEKEQIVVTNLMGFLRFLPKKSIYSNKILKFKMSVISASAILIAIKTLGIYRNDFSQIIGIEENNLEECCKEMYNFYVYNSTHNLQAIRKKFSSSKFNEVSKIKIC